MTSDAAEPSAVVGEADAEAPGLAVPPGVMPLGSELAGALGPTAVGTGVPVAPGSNDGELLGRPGSGVEEAGTSGVALAPASGVGEAVWSTGVGVGVWSTGVAVGVGVGVWSTGVGVLVGVAVGVAVGPSVGVGPGVFVGGGGVTAPPPRQVTLTVAGQVAIEARTVRSPSTRPKWTVTVDLPLSSVTVVRGLTESDDDWPFLISHLIVWPVTRRPVSASRTVAVIWGDDAHETAPEGASKLTL
jgi:hypothetical protein